jgi:hypothetical protein
VRDLIDQAHARIPRVEDDNDIGVCDGASQNARQCSKEETEASKHETHFRGKIWRGLFYCPAIAATHPVQLF